MEEWAPAHDTILFLHRLLGDPDTELTHSRSVHTSLQSCLGATVGAHARGTMHPKENGQGEEALKGDFWLCVRDSTATVPGVF